MEERIVVTNDDEIRDIEILKKSEGKNLIRIEDHITEVDVNGNEVREKALVFSDIMPSDEKSIIARVEELEARLTILEGV